MKRVMIVIIVFSLLLPTVLTGCGQRVGSNGVVNVHNWGEYIDESIFRIFERETGIRVNYSTFETNEALYALMRRGGANIDVIIPSDYMIARMIEEDMLEELDFSNIPNFELIDPRYKGLAYDPDNRFSVAYMTGTVGIIYNSSFITDDITSWNALFDERYAGQILMFDNPRDAFGITLKYLGYSLNTVNEDEIHEAFDLLVRQKPILQAYVMDQIFDKLEGGEAWIGPYYAGDFLAMLENNPDLRFARPTEGTNFFVDAMCIPKDAANKTNAEVFINFMTRTDIAMMNMAYIFYASANQEAAAMFAAEISAEEYAVMFASSEVIANSEVYSHLPRHILELYDRLWVELKR
ncbi:MAG: ABC transporter substrate-binding protein [Oscillospiraceae bacterium]|nr:ABC transporter substrate-binding protein [Oscillospiraceae bacterium]